MTVLAFGLKSRADLLNTFIISQCRHCVTFTVLLCIHGARKSVERHRVTSFILLVYSSRRVTDYSITDAMSNVFIIIIVVVIVIIISVIIVQIYSQKNDSA